MIVVGTKPEYFNAVWVKNEWSRYLALIKNGADKTLIPAYRDMDPYDLPEEFSYLQALDMSRLGFMQDLVHGVKKIINLDVQKATIVNENIVINDNNVTPLLKRGFMFLEDENWESASEYFDRVLDIDPENASAYLGKLLSDLEVTKQEDLVNIDIPFDDNINFKKAIRFGDEKLKSDLNGAIDYINERNKRESLESKYELANDIMEVGDTEDEFLKAAKLFEDIIDYLDSKNLAEECYEMAEIARKDAILSEGESKMTGEDISNYEAAIKLFESISGWQDADEKVNACQKKIEEINAKIEADRLEKERLAELARKEAEKRAKRNKKIAIIVCVVVAFIIVLNKVIIPNNKYNDAVALMDAGNLDEALNIFQELNNHKDSEEKARNIRIIKIKEKFKNANVGSYVTFGAYEQDNNDSNGKENVEWLVLAKEDNKVLVISRYALDCLQYNTSRTDVTWENCSLRTWLNGAFINNAFSEEEQATIPTVTVSADKNPEYSTDPGNTTQDKVFLLSINEANQYFTSDEARKCASTDYAIAQGAFKNKEYIADGRATSLWWLRTPAKYQDTVVEVREDGYVGNFRTYVDISDIAVRPALWITLDS